MKRFLSVAMVICLLLSIWTVPAVADGERKSGLFTYELKGNGNAVITEFDWSANGENDVYVPNQIDGYNVTEIGANAFEGNDDEVVVVLPNTITVIGEKAFYRCQKITSVTIPASVQIIGAGAFAGCRNIKQYSVAPGNETYTTIDGILYDKVNKELVSYPGGATGDVKIPDGIVSIGEYAFYGVGGKRIDKKMDALWLDYSKAITIPASVIQIKDYAFCNSQTSNLFGENVAQIGNHAFEYAFFASEGIPFPNVETIGDYAFNDCDFDISLGSYKSEITFPQTLKQIGEYSFANAGGHNECSFDLSSTQLVSIPAYSFYACYVEALILPDTIKEIGESAIAYLHAYDDNIGAFTTDPETAQRRYYDSFGISIIAFKLPSSVETIGSNAFEGLWLTFLIPDDSHLKSIGEKAFLGVKFANNVVYLSDYAKELQLPEGLEEIGSEAFNMAQLKVLSIPAWVNPIFCVNYNKAVQKAKQLRERAAESSDVRLIAS